MANNSSSTAGRPFSHSVYEKMILVQVLVFLFLSINIMLILTFFSKDIFYTSMRYILFAHTLLSDCVTLCLSNLLLVLSSMAQPIHLWLCVIIFILTTVCNFLTPLTLTAMTVERYVAVCMPLRHAELCSARGALPTLLAIHGLSFIPCTAILLLYFVTSDLNTRYMVCQVEKFAVYNWQRHLRSAISQSYFLLMFVVIVFSYVHIAKAAKAASGDDRSLSRKGLRTVLLHGFQLLLSLIQLFCPLVETAVLQINVMMFINLRYFNYIMFMLAPRCLSPLIYGVRDEKFFLALKYYALCGYLKNKL